MAYLTKVLEKGKSTNDLGNQQNVHVTLEARVDDSIQIMEFPLEVGKKKGVRIKESDIPGSSALEEWHKRSAFTQNFLKFPYFDSRKQRRTWTDGNYDPLLHGERQN